MQTAAGILGCCHFEPNAWIQYMKSSDAKVPFEIFIFNDDFNQTCIFKFSDFT